MDDAGFGVILQMQPSANTFIITGTAALYDGMLAASENGTIKRVTVLVLAREQIGRFKRPAVPFIAPADVDFMASLKIGAAGLAVIGLNKNVETAF
jgi:hypothetical protein